MTQGGARAQGQDLAVALALFASRHAQLVPVLAPAIGVLPGALGSAAAALQELTVAARHAGAWAHALSQARQGLADAQVCRSCEHCWIDWSEVHSGGKDHAAGAPTGAAVMPLLGCELCAEQWQEMLFVLTNDGKKILR